MKTKRLCISAFLITSLMIFFSQILFAQTNTFPSTGSAGIGTTSPDHSSLLEVASTRKGVLIPRMTQTQRASINAPATGLLLYQTNKTSGFYYYDGSKWTAVASKGVNKSLSNLTAPTAVNIDLLPGADNSVNLGSAPASWKNLYLDGSVYLGGSKFLAYKAGSGDKNTAVGSLALNANTSGSSNTGLGFNALYSNTTGYSNVAIGINALKNNIDGFGMVAVGDSALFNQTINSNGYYQNTGIGYKALYSNTTGWLNTATGDGALYSNSTGISNTAIGQGSLYSNTTSSANTATGTQALFYNTTGYRNTANGASALFDNQTGSDNTAIGEYALLNNQTGSSNTVVGSQAMNQATTGYSNVAIGVRALIYSNESNLVAVGDSALFWNGFNVPAGAAVVAVGSKALYNNTSGGSNSAFGFHSLYKGTTGSYNVAAGTYAGDNLTDGSNNTFLGYNANSGTGGHIINAMALGNQASVTSNNHVVVGNSSVTSIGGYANWSNLSDGRVKKNIKQNVPGLEFINKLQPVTYNLDLDAADKIIDLPARKDKDGRTIQPSQFETDSRKAKEQIVYTGFIAQDVEKAAKSLNYDFSGIDKPDNANTLYGLRYSDFVVPLVKAVQELSKQNDSLKKAMADQQSVISNQQKINNDLQKQFNDLKSLVLSIQQCSPCNTSGANAQTYNTIITDAPSLEQNVPNPFNHITSIGYTLPQKFTTAQIMITDKNGKTLKLVNLSGAGKGKIDVDAFVLSSGAYNYSLLIDGKLIGTKQMVLTK